MSTEKMLTAQKPLKQHATMDALQGAAARSRLLLLKYLPQLHPLHCQHLNRLQYLRLYAETALLRTEKHRTHAAKIQGAQQALSASKAERASAYHQLKSAMEKTITAMGQLMKIL